MAVARNVPDIFTDLVREFASLFRSEIRLARAEISEKISLVGLALGMFVAGAALLMAALVLLLEAAVVALVEQAVLSPTAATLLVAGGALLVGVVLLWVAVNRIQARHLAPKRMVDQLQRDAAVARMQVRP
jgi:hypothetical protein